jgi:hypothetical protein
LFHGFLSCLPIKPDIIALQETKLSSDVLDSELPLNDYQIFRRDRNQFGGGVLIAVLNKFSVTYSFVDPVSEIVFVGVQFGSSFIDLVNVYRPCCTERSTIFSLRTQLSLLTHKISERSVLLCCGDFNTPDYVFPDRYTTVPTSDILDTMSDNFLSNVVNYPTRLGKLLDLVFVSHADQVSSHPIGGVSDHLGNLLTVSFLEASSRDLDVPDRSFRNFEKIDLTLGEKVIATFRGSFDRDFDLRSVAQNYELIKDVCRSLLETCVPQQRVWGKSPGNVYPPRAIQIEISKKMKLHACASSWGKVAGTSGCVGSPKRDPSVGVSCNGSLSTQEAADQLARCRENAIASYQDQRRKVKTLIRAWRRRTMADVAYRARSCPKLFWNFANRFRKRHVAIPTLIEGPVSHSTPFSKAEVLASNFVESFREEPVMPDVFFQSGFVVDEIPNLTVFAEGVENLLGKLNFRKAVGSDGISSRILKVFAHSLSVPVARFFQQTFDMGILPPDWKHAIVCPIPKKGTRTSPGNYRPISLTSQLCKVFEHILVSNMHTHLAKHDLLTPYQHGFRKLKSCESALVSTLQGWADPLDQLLSVDAVFLDFEKAFDRVPHRRLIRKLNALGVRGAYSCWITDFLANRSFSVRVDGSLSVNRSVVSGVPQGSVLGPLLFICYINDIVRNITSSICLYADDVMLSRPVYSSDSCFMLQHDVCVLEKWSRESCMTFNLSKCKSMRISLLRTCDVEPFKYSLGSGLITPVESFRYLGVLLSSTHKPREHIGVVIGKANRVIGVMKRNFSHASVRTRKRLFMALVRPVLEYAGSAWDPYLAVDVDSLEACQNRAVRFVAGEYSWTSSISAMKDDLQIGSLAARRAKSRKLLLRKHCLYGGVNLLTSVPVLQSGILDPGSYRRQEGKYSFLFRTLAENLPAVRHVHDDGG